MVLPAPPIEWIGTVEGIWGKGMTSLEQLVMRSGVCIEIWCGKNPYEAIDMYHGMIVRDVMTPNTFAHYHLTGEGTEPIRSHVKGTLLPKLPKCALLPKFPPTMGRKPALKFPARHPSGTQTLH